MSSIVPDRKSSGGFDLITGGVDGRVDPIHQNVAFARACWRKRGQAPFAGTARRVLRTKGARPLFRPARAWASGCAAGLPNRWFSYAGEPCLLGKARAEGRLHHARGGPHAAWR